MLVERLAAAGCVAPAEEAAELVAAAPDEATLDAWVRRREAGEPLAWIIGSTVFCGRRLRVVPGVYVPRPQTEALARRALALGGRSVDLCTGSGAIAAVVGGIGVELDPVAAACARANGVPVVVGDLDAPLRGRFDVVTAVAPYVPTAAVELLPSDVRGWEPRGVLDGGDDGLAVVRRVVDAARRLLEPGGWLLVELGGDQPGLLDLDGFSSAETWTDDEGDVRGLAVRR